MDVCAPTASMLSNRLKWPRDYLKYLNVLIGLIRENGVKATFFFIPGRTVPTSAISRDLVDLQCEIAMHADEVLPQLLLSQRQRMEQMIEDDIHGLSYHGRDLSDFIIHKLTRKNRYIAYHNPFASLRAGFRYDATGFVSDKPRFLEFGNERILLFPGFIDLTAGSFAVRYKTYCDPEPLSRIGEVTDPVSDAALSIFLIHPFYLSRYGFKKSRMRSVASVFDYVRKNNIPTKTYNEVLDRMGKH